MDKGNMNSVVFLDIRKAFDTVNHEILSDKLNCYGIGDEELLFFGSYLGDRTQCCSARGGTLNVEVIGMLVKIFFWKILKKYLDFDFKPLKNTQIAIFRAALRAVLGKIASIFLKFSRRP